MDLKQLRTFKAVATLRSFGQAADLLGYAQSTVSEQIKALEADLDVRLFDRDGRRVSITPAGEVFLRYAEKMADLEEEARTEIRGSGEIHGSLSIRVPETIITYYLPPVLKAFRTRLPRVDLQFNSCSYYGLAGELRSGIMNLAFLIAKDFGEPDLETHVLQEVPLVVVASPSSPIAAQSRVSIDDLSKVPVFATSSDCSYFRVLEQLFAEEKRRFATLYHINSIEAIKRNVSAGNGVALLTDTAVRRELTDGQLAELPLETGPLSARVLMIRLKNRWHPPMLDAFMEAVKESLPWG